MITATAWIWTAAALLGLVALDLLVSHRRRTAPSLRAASAWSVAYVGVALAFGVVLVPTVGGDVADEFLAGYAVEKSLSIDNLFVFAAIMAAVGVPSARQPRALSIGLTAALVLRAAFIVAGGALLHSFTWAFALFGAILLVTAVQLVRHREHPTGLADGRLMAWLRRRSASSTRLAVTAMVAADVLFGLDSIPAVYGVTEHPYVVVSANAFALLGMRPLYFVVSGLVARLRYLPLGMAAILGFIAIKLILHAAHAITAGIPVVSDGLSLAVILGLLGASVAASLLHHRHTHRAPAQMGPRPHGAQDPSPAR